MQITESLVTKLVVSGAKNSDGFTLDPISLYLEDFGQGRGKLTVGCWDTTWSYFWGAMGNRTLEEFILKTNNSYLANKLKREGEKFTELDIDVLKVRIKQEIITDRCQRSISRDVARDRWDRLDAMDFDMPLHPDCEEVSYLDEVFGPDWWEGLPERTSSHGQWLWDILNAVREVLRQRTEAAAA